MKNRLYHGVAYYPELWDDKVVEDIRYMKETGINVVRMGEFAWAKMEPEEDKIDLGFFVSMINTLYENGIETIMCTPTPTPPIWISHNHPERMFMDGNAVIMSHGARQHACTNNLYFRERSRIIVEAVAKAVGKLPGVIAWQTDNEFKCHVSECFCIECKKLWFEWLKKRYGTIENLNAAWGTQIWSQYYQNFTQVPQPFKTPFVHNSSLSNAYRMFSREKIAEYQEEQVKIIRKYSDAHITHNTNIFFALDNELMFKELNFAAFDAYPDCDDYSFMLMNYDIFRNVKKERPFWVMETSTSHNGYLELYTKSHRNGFVTAEAIAAYAMGATGFSYWLWRQQRTGCEQPHGSVLSCWGKPTVGYENVLKTDFARKQIEEVILSTEICQAELAITYSDRARVFFLVEPLENLDYIALMKKWYENILETGVHRDLLFEQSSLNKYKILMTPYLPYVSEEYLERAKAFVEEGGVWIVGPLTGGRTVEHTVHTDAALGKLEEFAGVETAYAYPMTGTNAFGHAFGVTAPLSLWSAVFIAKGAKVVGTIDGGITPGMAFITEHKQGKGKIVMIGSMPEGHKGSEMLKSMIEYYCAEVAVVNRTDVTPGTIVTSRFRQGSIYWIVVNMDGRGGSVTLPRRCMDLMEGGSLESGRIEIGKYGYKVIRFER